MNTVGKILVILNFLFAILIGALLIMDVALRNQWKEAYFALKNETTILKGDRDTNMKATGSVTADYQRIISKLEDQKRLLNEKETTWTLTENEYKLQIATRDQKIDDQKTTLAETAALLKRVTEEINLLTKTIKDREALIVKHEADNKVLRARAQHAEQQLATATARNESLLEELRGVMQKLAKKDAGINPGVISIKSPNEPNPPAVRVDGKVEKVDGDLVLISLGTDHNVNKDNTLDIYRLQPESKYLGMIRIVDANNHKSVGRLIPSGNAQFRPALREGDLVTSKLTK